MKPRKRAQQKQSSRLFLRNKDHRDVIMNDIYHNALYAEQIEDPKDEKKKTTGLLWVKYPRLYFMQGFSRFEQFFGYHQYKFTVDIDRQFVYDDGYGLFGANGTRVGYFKKLRDIWIAGSDVTGASIMNYITDDGIIYKQQEEIYMGGNRYGKNGLIVSDNEGSGVWNYQMKFLELDDDGKLYLDHSILTKRLWNDISINVYLGPLNEGALFLAWDQWNLESNQYLYKVDGGRTDGNVYIDIIEMTPRVSRESIDVKYCRKGSFLAMAIVQGQRESQYTPYRNYSAFIMSTSDNGATFNERGFIELTIRTGTSGEYIRTKLVERKGYFYFYGQVAGDRLYGWKSTDGITWIELNLPDYLDIPTITEGSYVYPFVPEYYRLILDPNVATGEENEINIWNVLTGEEMLGFKEGEHITKLDMTDEEYLYFTASDLHFFIDNMIFLSSEKNFSFKIDWGTQTNVPDMIMEGDYCYEQGGGRLIPYWQYDIDYEVNDLVSYGRIWICLKKNKNQEPMESEYWAEYNKKTNPDDIIGG